MPQLRAPKPALHLKGVQELEEERESLLNTVSGMVTQIDEQLGSFNERQREFILARDTHREKAESKTKMEVQKEAQLKREIKQMRRDLEGTFGRQKIIEMENVLMAKREVRRKLQADMEMLEKVNVVQEKAIGEETVLRSKGNRQIKKLEEEKAAQNVHKIESQKQSDAVSRELRETEKALAAAKGKTERLLKAVRKAKELQSEQEMD